jgi:hypothetical protein
VDPQLEEIVRELESASARVHDLLRRLGPTEWSRRPAPDSWSAVECVAHLNLTSVAMLPLIHQGIEDARQRGRTSGRRYRRDFLGWLLWKALSAPGRFKVKTAAPFVPRADRPHEEVIAEFDRLQALQIAAAREADGLPIDRVKMTSPFNAKARYTVFSGLCILPRHQHRHLWQAEQAARTSL